MVSPTFLITILLQEFDVVFVPPPPPPASEDVGVSIISDCNWKNLIILTTTSGGL